VSTENSPSVLAPLPPGVAPTVWERARGSRIWTTDGRELIDLTSGVLIANLGHSHPRVVDAVADQAGRLVATFVAHHPWRVRYATKLLAATDGAFEGVALASTGAEAVDAAVRVARVATRRRTVLSFVGGYHGKTTETMLLGGLPALRREAQRWAADSVLHLPFPRVDPAASIAESAAEVERVVDLATELARATAPDDVAAVLVEPYLGAGGGVVPPSGFLDACRQLADRLGARLILDEVQSGFGRTGPLFAFQTMARPPDLLVLAKGIANGLPMAAVLGRASDLAAAGAGTLWGSYSGNPLACAAATATLEALQEEVDPARTDTKGGELVATIRSWGTPGVREVRGVGYSIGIELHGESGPQRAAAVVAAAADAGAVLLPPAGANGSVLRVAPPLTASDEELERGLTALRVALDGTALSG
jgi:4-aminobutyrate aminotransferase-like enzyme